MDKQLDRQNKQTIGSAKQVGNEETFIVCNLTFLAFPFGCSEMFLHKLKLFKI